MLKKHLKYTNAENIFIHFSFACILCQMIALILFLTMPASYLFTYEVMDRGVVMLENIICSVTLAVTGYFIMKYEFAQIKSK